MPGAAKDPSDASQHDADRVLGVVRQVTAELAGSQLDVGLAEQPLRAGFARFLARLGELYREHPCLWRGDASVRTFAARVAHNRAVDHLSKYRRLGEDELDEQHPDPVADPLGHAEVHQRRGALLDAVQRLPLGHRQVVVLALEGFSQREIGQALALEENTVAQRLSRARRQLRDEMGVSA